VDSSTHDMVAQCAAGGKHKSDLLSTHTRLWYRLQVRRWSESVELCLLPSQTKCDWSLAVVEADVDSATHDMVAQCSAGGKHKSDLLSTHTRLSYRLQVRRWSEAVDLPLLPSQTKCNWSLAAVETDVDSGPHDMVAQCAVRV
jgi:hypothetical protein